MGKLTGVGSVEAQRGAGVALLLAATSVTVGAILGGVPGAFTGLLLAGGVRNARRASSDWSSEDPKRREEAGKSGVLALLELGMGGVIAYKMLTSEEKK